MQSLLNASMHSNTKNITLYNYSQADTFAEGEHDFPVAGRDFYFRRKATVENEMHFPL